MRAQVAILLALATAFPPGDSTVSSCNPNPCLNGGTCMDMGAMYICVCEPEYLGMDCETREIPVALTRTEEDPCAANPCRNGGLCFRQDRRGTSDMPYQCVCPTGFAGTFCDTITLTSSACDGTPCQNGGTCELSSDSDTGYVCRCVDSIRGSNCEIMPCDTNPCNGGDCFAGYRNKSAFLCRCPLGFKGDNCEKTDPCMNNPCGEGNMCIPGGDDDFSCMYPSVPGGTCLEQPGEGDGETGGTDTNTGGTDGAGETDSGSSGTGSGGSGGTDVSGGENAIPQVGGGSGGSNSGSGANSELTKPCNLMMRQSHNCSNHQGYCHEDDTGAICRCYTGFRGVDCEQVDDGSSNGGSGSTGSGSGTGSSGAGGETGTGSGSSGS